MRFEYAQKNLKLPNPSSDQWKTTHEKDQWIEWNKNKEI